MVACYSIKKIIVWLFLPVFLCFLTLASALASTPDYSDPALYSPPDPNPPAGLQKAFDTSAGSPLDAVAVQGSGFNNTATFQSIIGKILYIVLAILGVIFLILAIVGGYNWMTAQGNEEKVEKAKNTITHAITGLVIVLSAYLIARFVVEVIGGMVFKGV